MLEMVAETTLLLGASWVGADADYCRRARWLRYRRSLRAAAGSWRACRREEDIPALGSFAVGRAHGRACHRLLRHIPVTAGPLPGA